MPDSRMPRFRNAPRTNSILFVARCKRPVEFAWQSVAVLHCVTISMSKQRPSRQRPVPTTTGASSCSPQPDFVSYWRRRVFRNTYTRNGRTLRVKKWSVKIQHQGRRRTYSLAATSRTGAAREAQFLYQLVRTEGWDAAAQAHDRAVSPLARRSSNARGDELPKSDAGYWRERLIHSKYRDARLMPIKEFTVRIEEGGIYQCFPLGTDDKDRAAAEALKIYRTIMTKGWEGAFQ